MLSRKHWDRDAIQSIVADGERGEAKIKNIIQSLFTEDEKVALNAHYHGRERYDIRVSSGECKDVLKLELETGLTLKYWDDKLPRSMWPMGTNVLMRKIGEGKHFDVFVKFSPTFRSFFACTYDYALQKGKIKTIKNHSLGFKTCDEVFAIGWEHVKNGDEYAFDNLPALKHLILTQLIKKLASQSS
jgi:hypothetical protein